MITPISRWLRGQLYGESRPCETAIDTELAEQARELRAAIQPYLHEDDPLRALMNDLLDKRHHRLDRSTADDPR